jgi:2-polyprenyl-3-methyl-5-hydroxy-6-metoxy-1,4-benzoquinol methylase
MNCQFCLTPLERVFIDLGDLPSANRLVRSDQLKLDEPRYRHKVFVCEKCLLVQIPPIHKADDMFTDNYVYYSSYAKSWVEHARQYVEKMIERQNLGEDSFVVEVASNDGYLLQNFVRQNIPCLGVDPAANCAAAASEKGVETRVEFFTASSAQVLSNDRGQADLILGNNVFAHVPNVNDFVSGIAHLLKAAGILTLEFPHLARMIENNQFDTIYDEHFSYFSLQVARNILARHGLRVFDVEELPTHGGSLRLFACHDENQALPTLQIVEAVLEAEGEQGLLDISGYGEFQQQADAIRDDFLSLVREEKAKDSRIAAFGAAAKGNTFLNYCDIGADSIDFVVDDTPAKQGLFLPGSHVPIVDEQKIRDEKPDLIVILPWNFRKEIEDKLSYTRQWGARFVTCIPQVAVS